MKSSSRRRRCAASRGPTRRSRPRRSRASASPIYDANGEGWAWGQLAADGYVGWLPENALAPPGAAPTHKVTALRTLVFPGPSIKLPPLEALPSRRARGRRARRGSLGGDVGRFVCAGGAPCAARRNETDFVAVAERFLGTPYLWGGKTALGLDCSGLVQVALTACGVSCPRDSDMQEKALGTAVAADPSALLRGDLIFWKGHVAIVRGPDSLLHANAHHMAVAIEPVAQAVARIRDAGSEITSIRRIACYLINSKLRYPPKHRGIAFGQHARSQPTGGRDDHHRLHSLPARSL